MQQQHSRCPAKREEARWQQHIKAGPGAGWDAGRHPHDRGLLRLPDRRTNARGVYVMGARSGACPSSHQPVLPTFDSKS
eukprot:1161977-Pelagomonas_calceolata.AAC.2